MKAPAIAQLVVRLPHASVLASAVSVTGPSLTLEFGGRPTSTPWTGSVTASRYAGRWRRGRDGGPATLDVVPANDRESLVLLQLEQPAGVLARQLTTDDAHATARALRSVLETRAATADAAASITARVAPDPQPAASSDTEHGTADAETVIAPRLRPA